MLRCGRMLGGDSWWPVRVQFDDQLTWKAAGVRSASGFGSSIKWRDLDGATPNHRRRHGGCFSVYPGYGDAPGRYAIQVEFTVVSEIWGVLAIFALCLAPPGLCQAGVLISPVLVEAHAVEAGDEIVLSCTELTGRERLLASLGLFDGRRGKSDPSKTNMLRPGRRC